MRLSELLEALPPGLAPVETLAANPHEDPPIRGIQIDSRAVAPGDLFVALRGSQADGHHFLGAAGKLGAVAFLVEAVPDGVDLQGRPTLVVRDTRRALAPLATRFYGNPSAELTLVGVTGTNGKTSTTYLVESILQQAGREVGVIGTVEVRYAGERHRAINTTPESLELQRLLRAMRTRGVDAVAMEVSSHGLALGRVDGCRCWSAERDSTSARWWTAWRFQRSRHRQSSAPNWRRCSKLRASPRSMPGWPRSIQSPPSVSTRATRAG